MIEKRKNLDNGSYVNFSQIIVKKLKNILDKINFSSIALYYPINKEVDIIPAIEELLENSKCVYLPKIIGKKMFMAKVDSLDNLKKSNFNIPEPVTDDFSSLIDIYVIPAIAYDFQKYRIGYGGGYYDRYFQENKKTFLIGTIFDFQLVESFIKHENDLKVDLVITEKRILNSY